MSSTDSRIVTIKFDNVQFKREAQSTNTMLDKLKNNMSFSGAQSAASRSLGGISGLFTRLKSNMNFGGAFSGISRGFSGISNTFSRFSRLNPFSRATTGVGDLQRDTNRFSVEGITGGITEINKGWLAMTTVALTAIANITTAAVQAGAQWAKSLTLDPIISGFQEYETKLGSIQTILANTGLKGKKGLAEVNGKLTELNRYSDKTIYNFSEMAKNIGTFTAAGVDLDTSVSSIKGIANLAALSGSNSQQASTAMYQLSQALASGKVSLMDWNSVVNAGMGGKVFQDALTRTATNMGTLNDNAVKTTGPMKMLSINGKSFRESISSEGGKTWLTSDVLTKTLSQLSGDMTDAQLKAQGFTDSQIKAIQEMAKTGVNAATKVKTVTQLMDTLKESVGSGWAQSFEIIFGNFTEAKELWTSVSNTLGGMIQSSAKARNKLLTDWDALGGRTDIIQGIKNAFAALMDIMKPLKDAFHEIFPPTTAEDLKSFSEGFKNFTKGLSISDETAQNLKRTFAGVFAVFHILFSIVGQVFGLFGRLSGAVSDSSGGFLDFTGGIGDFLVSVDDALTKGGALERFFDGLGDVLAVPLGILKTVAGWIGKLFSGFDLADSKVVTNAADNVHDSLQPVSEIGKAVGNIFGKLGGWLADAAKAVGHALSNIGNAIASAVGPGTFNKALSVINTALIGGILLLLKNFFDKGLSVDLTGGIGDSIKQTLGSVQGALQSMQMNVKADIIIKIATALAILSAAILVLSTIDPAKMTIAMGALTAGFGGLSGALIVLSKTLMDVGSLKLVAISMALVAISTSLLIMAGAIKVMASIPLGDMLRGMAGFAGALFILTKALNAISKNPGGLIRTAVALGILSVSLNLIATAMRIMGGMDLISIGKGLLAMAGSLGIIAGAMQLMPKGMVLQAAGLVLIGIALNAIATAMKIFGSMDVGEIAKALVVLGGSMVIIGAAMNLMPGPLMLLTAAGLVAVGVALNIIAGALKIMGSMSWEEIAKSMVVLAGSLTILSAALILMEGSLPGAAALVVTAGAIAILTPALVAMGAMSWEGIAKSLITLAGALTIIGAAGVILTPVIPSLLGLGAALVLLGAGIALAGAGALGFATAFAEIVAVGQQGVRIFSQIIRNTVKSIPSLMKAFGKGLSGLAKEVRKAGPDFAKAWASTLSAFLDGIIKNAPKFATAFLKMLEAGLKVLTGIQPRIVRAGLDMMIAFMKAISEKIPRMADLAADIVTKLLNGIARNNQKVVNAGVRLIIDTINDMADAIDNHSEALGRAGVNLGTSIIAGIGRGIAGGAQELYDSVKGVASDALNAAKDFLGIHSPSRKFRDEVGRQMAKGMADGVKHHKSKKHVRDAIVSVSRDALEHARKILRRIGGHHSLIEELFPKKRHHHRQKDDPLQGMAEGFKKHRHKHQKDLEKEVVRVSKDALERARKILRQTHHKDLAEALKPKHGHHHKITPVLDLGKVKKDAKKLHDVIDRTRPINPYVSSGRARYISADKRAATADVNQATPVATQQAPVQYVQNNYSPKALNPVEIYRNTNNQLAKTKEALKKK